MNQATNLSLNRYKEKHFSEFLALPGLTEIAVNRPGEIFTKIGGQWARHIRDIGLDDCERFISALATYHGDNIDDMSPVLSATLESGERCQIIRPPACERNTVSITIRKPSDIYIAHQNYVDNGFYNRITGHEQVQSRDQELEEIYHSGDIALFMEKAVEYGKTILFVGETGSGKTTYMKTMIGYIPTSLRIVTIEDNPEVSLPHHPNHVRLFYPADAGEKALVTPASLVRANYRMNPDRILLAEVRGGEAWDCLKIIGSGHEGLITSLHAGSPQEALTGMVERCYQNPECQNIPYSILLAKVMKSVDIVASIDVKGNVRRMGDLYFKPLHHAAMMETFRNERV
ncbi:P-type DNA transfer ATPase VirB11 [Enterobacter mori]|uniref:P-type DNA transfer ATPase VirB11 n=1 Tax=Enterobacter mori TaxID=539813 RepID=UPI001BE07B28|nr:P-type DNA transfer ATPase VirB11 [Enterobacter mori]MBT1872798.1 P-type DNA transfer ATPase VirB11 [Enterobacter mori]HCM9655495.1 P-type DNA transfer ATPase VirB11 [Enterobacter kobei]